MKNILKLLLAVIFVLFYDSAYAGYIGTLRNDIEKIIAPVSGKITSADNKYIVINKGSADNIRPGAVISRLFQFSEITEHINTTEKSYILKKLYAMQSWKK